MGRVRYVGEPVAMVVAETAAIAEDARELIDVEYRDLPAGRRRSTTRCATGAPQLHDDVPGNLAFEFESGDAAGGRRRVRAREIREQAHGRQPAPRRQPAGAARVPRRVRRRERALHVPRAAAGHRRHARPARRT